MIGKKQIIIAGIIIKAFLSLTILAQPPSITVTSVSQRTDGSGLVDVYFNLSGPASAYNIAMQASFDGGNTYTPIPPAFLNGDIAGITPGSNKHIVWDGLGSFPNTFSTQARLEISATKVIGGGIPCPGIPTVTDIDGNVYNTVLIGNQCWMKENLNTTRDAAGNNITRYCYNNNPDYCNWYGGLYTWYTVMNGANSSNSNPSGAQGICPEGWHVPSDVEWSHLVDYVVSQGFPNSNVVNGVGNALKSCRQVNSPLGGDCNTSSHPRWEAHSTHHGFDEFGFSALPAGSLYLNGQWLDLGEHTRWWTSSAYSSSNAWYRYKAYSYGGVTRPNQSKSYGCSLRCIKN